MACVYCSGLDFIGRCEECGGVGSKFIPPDSQLTEKVPAIKSISHKVVIHGGDPVNHPAHYNLHPSGIECIEIIRHHTLNIGNVIKYLWRAGLKGVNKEIEDMEKAMFYLDDEIKRLKQQKEKIQCQEKAMAEKF